MVGTTDMGGTHELNLTIALRPCETEYIFKKQNKTPFCTSKDTKAWNWRFAMALFAELVKGEPKWSSVQTGRAWHVRACNKYLWNEWLQKACSFKTRLPKYHSNWFVLKRGLTQRFSYFTQYFPIKRTDTLRTQGLSSLVFEKLHSGCFPFFLSNILPIFGGRWGSGFKGLQVRQMLLVLVLTAFFSMSLSSADLWGSYGDERYFSAFFWNVWHGDVLFWSESLYIL